MFSFHLGNECKINIGCIFLKFVTPECHLSVAIWLPSMTQWHKKHDSMMHPCFSWNLICQVGNFFSYCLFECYTVPANWHNPSKLPVMIEGCARRLWKSLFAFKICWLLLKFENCFVKKGNFSTPNDATFLLAVKQVNVFCSFISLSGTDELDAENEPEEQLTTAQKVGLSLTH